VNIAVAVLALLIFSGFTYAFHLLPEDIFIFHPDRMKPWMKRIMVGVGLLLTFLALLLLIIAIVQAIANYV